MYRGLEEILRAAESAAAETEHGELLRLAKTLARSVREHEKQVLAYAGVISALDDTGEMLARLDEKWTP